MQCPFCQQEMRAIDNGRPPPQLAMVWVCKNCPNEVRIMAEKEAEGHQWITKHTSIFVKYNEKEYCLHWDYVRKHFDIRDIGTSTGPDSYIMRTQAMPDSITPVNALEKLRIYLIFS